MSITTESRSCAHVLLEASLAVRFSNEPCERAHLVVAAGRLVAMRVPSNEPIAVDNAHIPQVAILHVERLSLFSTVAKVAAEAAVPFMADARSHRREERLSEPVEHGAMH